jgi:hypothetical protein
LWLCESSRYPASSKWKFVEAFENFKQKMACKMLNALGHVHQGHNSVLAHVPKKRIASASRRRPALMHPASCAASQSANVLPTPRPRQVSSTAFPSRGGTERRCVHRILASATKETQHMASGRRLLFPLGFAFMLDPSPAIAFR